MAGINRQNSSIKYISRAQLLSVGIKCVFISHQKADKAEAKKIADYLINANIDVYFDEYDADLKFYRQSNNPSAVTTSICTGINNSSHMLVLVSPSTLYSTWVPFEIGYGFDKTDLSVLCLKGILQSSLPEYIKTASIIRDIYDLNTKIAAIRGLNKDYLLQTKSIIEFNSINNPLKNSMDTIIITT